MLCMYAVYAMCDINGTFVCNVCMECARAMFCIATLCEVCRSVM